MKLAPQRGSCFFVEILGLSILSGISYGMVLFLAAVGLSLVFGFMGILNLAHGVIFMLGGYVGTTVAKATGNFIFGLLAGAGSAGLVGLLIERGVLRHLYKEVLGQILVTLGFVYIITNLTIWIWTAVPQPAFVPPILAGSVSTGRFMFPIYRLAIIPIGIAICFCLWWLQEKTKVGAIIRAGMDDAQMTSALGINLTPIILGSFVFGSALAGFAGVVGTLLTRSVEPMTGIEMLFIALAVVVVGGVGSIQGTLAGALLIGTIHNLVATYFPELAMFTMYLVMVLILLVKPTGLLGRTV
jgi:branched-chain amino acid transport system permease protein